jgi:SpoVK/Ycf46/Vps4 family AAA+-type ATPase
MEDLKSLQSLVQKEDEKEEGINDLGEEYKSLLASTTGVIELTIDEIRLIIKRATKHLKILESIKIDFSNALIEEEEDVILDFDRSKYEYTLRTRFDKIIGNEAVKNTLIQSICFPMVCPKSYKEMQKNDNNDNDGSSNQGYRAVCICGKPGTGKTELSKIVAEMCQRTLVEINTNILAGIQGESETNVTEKFEHVLKTHGILFFDEVDFLTKTRGSSNESDSIRALKTTLLLEFNTLMEKMKNNTFKGAIISATNFPDEIDDAMKRRLGKFVYTETPTERTREIFFKRFQKNLPSLVSVEYPDNLLALTENWTFLHLKNLGDLISHIHIQKMSDGKVVITTDETNTDERKVEYFDNNTKYDDKNTIVCQLHELMIHVTDDPNAFKNLKVLVTREDVKKFIVDVNNTQKKEKDY